MSEFESGQLRLSLCDLSSAPLPSGVRYLEGLNSAQQEAVLAPLNHAVQVLAGAGTGKTELISRRFVKLVNDLREMDVTSPDERILVVTFTNDAALGMRLRIHERLRENLQVELSEKAWISTFHQFCMKLLRLHALEVGLPPGFSILNTLEQKVLFKRLLQGVFAGKYSDLSDLLTKFELSDWLPVDVLSIEALQSLGITDVEGILDDSRVYQLVNRIKSAGLSPREFYQLALEQSSCLTEQLQCLPLPHDSMLKSLENVVSKIQAWQQAFQPWASPDWNPVQEVEDKAERTGKKLTASSYKDALPGLSRFYLASRTFEPLTPDAAVLNETLAVELRMIAVLATIYALYQQALLQQGVCDFDDLINHSIQLLVHRPELRKRYQERFKAIIVDEFQDSNGSQLRLLSLLIQSQASNLTVVGDEKQSIYAFRFAQPENLDLIFENSQPHRINLTVNYRSWPPILEVANCLTRKITLRANQELIPCERFAQQQELPLVTWLNFDATEAGDGEKARPVPIDAQKAKAGRFMAVEIAELARSGGYQFSDIVVLVRSHASAELVQQALAGFGIPAIRQKNLGFFQESVIKDAMALLRLMRNGGDDAALVRILQHKLNAKTLIALMALKRTLRQASEQSHYAWSLLDVCRVLGSQPELMPQLDSQIVVALGDLATRLLEIRRQKNKISAAQLFLRLVQAVGLIQPNTPAWQQKQQRVMLSTFEKLLHLFGQSRQVQPTLDEVLEVLEQYAADPNQELPVKEELEGENAVRIMTVFASKGLEFPVVFVANVEKYRDVTGDSALVFEPQYGDKKGFGLIVSKVNGMPNLKREIYQKCWQGPRAKKEAQRVFYVALTRAKERLYVLRSAQSAEWTDPDCFHNAPIRVISETRQAELLEKQYWQADQEAICQEMVALQEQESVVKMV